MENAIHAPVFQPTNAVALGEYQPSPHLPVNVHQAPYAAQDGDSLARAIASSMNFNRLPVPEPNIFLGDPLSYLEWRTAFKMLIEQKNISSQERIYYLKRYVGEPVRKALQGYFMNSSPMAYDNAMKLLDERYGHPFVTQKAYHDKLDRWPRVPPKDPMALRDFADFLLSCRDAINYIPSLSILNDCTENQRLLHKLPDWAAVRWNREVTATLDNTQSFPTFSQFVDFVMKEARVACNPVSSLYALHDTDAKPKSSKGHSSHVKVLATAATDQSSGVDNRTRICEYCQKEGHPIFKCNGFTAISLEERRAVVKAKKLCFGCLRKGHLSKDCKKKHVCGKCKGKHPTCLHDETFQRKQTTLVAESQIPSASSLHVSRSQGQCTSMIVPVWVSTKTNPSYEVLTYAILDTQSDTTFMLEETAASLQLPKQDVHLSLSTMTAKHTVIESHKICNIIVRGFKSTESVCINQAYTRDFIPASRSNIPVRETVQNWPHLQQLVDKLPPLQSCEVGLLIGFNCPQALAPRRILTGKDDEPYGIETLLGWSIVGFTGNGLNDTEHICHRVSIKEVPVFPPSDVLKLLEMDFANDKDNDAKVSQEDILFLDMLSKGINRLANKYLEMPLPFKKRPILPDNTPLALLRLEHLKRKLKRDDKYFQHYRQFMNEIIERGDAEPVTSEEHHGGRWYIPHHGVYHPQKPDKLRVVFDCSAKYKNASLNQHLLTGPDLTNALAGVLCRFRRYKVAFMCDIEKMFHQFLVPENDRDFLCFFWWKDADISTKPSTYRMRVHLFGAASSPGCANYGLKYLAMTQNNSKPEASSFIQHDFYVDDGLTSVQTEDEAIQLMHDAQEICASGGLLLHKFISNSRNVIKSMSESERASDVKLDTSLHRLPVKLALGIKWDIESDSFLFDLDIDSTPPTRRSILSAVASIFDPLGFLAPFVLIGKHILQACCQHGISWNDLLPKEKVSEWESWSEDLKMLKAIKIQRCKLPSTLGKWERIELHHFSDASMSGYGQCSYLRVETSTNIHCAFLIGKSRVAPVKVVTIPRLELTAAVLSVKVSMFLKRELGIPVSAEYFWTDSKVVLGYINNDARRFHVFVANRIQMIRESTEPSQWHYVETKNNPVDHASRGLGASDILSTNWLKGPSFLWQKDIQLPSNYDTDLQLGDPEVKVVRALYTESSTSSNILEQLSRVSQWTRLIAVVARIQRLSNGIRGTQLASVEERKKAQFTIIHLLQREVFKDVYTCLKNEKTLPSTNPLFPLDPIISNGLLCVGGRLGQSKLDILHQHPIILPRNSHISLLIMSHAHNEIKHQGRGMTLNKIRSLGFWIMGGSKVVAKFIRQCVTCRKLRRPTETQKMADLPQDRTEPSPPFTFCGMDCFGPFIIKQGRKELKRYGLLFTCMCSRAVHIEMLDDMTTDAFINSLRCFIAIRGSVCQIRSDQGSNFIGAKMSLPNWRAVVLNPFLLKSSVTLL